MRIAREALVVAETPAGVSTVVSVSLVVPVRVAAPDEETIPSTNPLAVSGSDPMPPLCPLCPGRT